MSRTYFKINRGNKSVLAGYNVPQAWPNILTNTCSYLLHYLFYSFVVVVKVLNTVGGVMRGLVVKDGRAKRWDPRFASPPMEKSCCIGANPGKQVWTCRLHRHDGNVCDALRPAVASC